MIRVEEAIGIVLENIKVLSPRKVFILEVLGRVLAEDIYSPIDIPPWNNSAMDGYAVRAEDIVGASRENPISLKIIEDLPAGKSPAKSIGQRETARIMTGAPIPEGANAVLPVEETQIVGTSDVLMFKPVKPGENVRLAAEDVKQGELVLKNNTVLWPPEIGMLASLGNREVKVIPSPLVAVLATGDELIALDEALSPGKIRNSNTYSLGAQITQSGAQVYLLGTAGDTREGIKEKIEEGFKEADMVLTTGGVSVGEYDLVKEIFKEIGGEIKFWQVAMKPGKPLVFGLKQHKPYFGIPGNPVAAMVVFEEFVRPAILKMMGHSNLFNPTIRAILKEDLKQNPGRRHYVRVKVWREDNRYVASSTGDQGSAILKSMVLANGLAIIPEDCQIIRQGEEVAIKLLPWTLTAFYNRPGNALLTREG